MTELRLAHGADVRVELVERRSRFLAWLRRAEDEPAARAVVAEARRAYPDARHHCSAFLVGGPGPGRVERSSDDGEPAGTAGMPMLQVLRGAGVTDVVAVVSRYFGGVKLGAGGLVRAYSGAVQAALDAAPLVRLEHTELWSVRLGHAEAGRVEAELRRHGFAVVETRYGDDGVELVVRSADGAALTSAVAAMTAGTAVPRLVGETVVERPA
ncbi:IMPACT family protein [Georgenia sp. TF02-10]|uniref:IMPACT family protein n=1 Tax=Georgenia sp. TF02-10 TaxID=2917725 RepID=UPI001FA7435D|nr:YigZ family protein [Georgenia sp. TF02-10]UNX55854.1 IMPACT family protein [Georgenia sp. TF02-10]